MSTKTFSHKSNARRAARVAGLDLTRLRFIQTDAGRWIWYEVTPDAEVVRTPVAPPDGGAAWAALYDEGVPASEQPPETVANPAPAKAPRGGKAAALVAAASSTAGITNTEIRTLTGWAKLGGFFDAVKRAGFVLRRVREDGDTRWFAVPGRAPGEPTQET